jgi:outer membrane protein assembly factor BamD (BamD/ComL family)
LFHQDEFEQASYIYQDILQTRYDCDEAQIGLVSAFYFLKKYEEAVVIADRYHERWLSAKSNQFVLQCLIKLSEQKAAAIDYQKV